MKKVLIVFITILALILMVGLGFFINKTRQPEEVACTLEAKLCPDGSAVGRMPPDCEFALCPGESSEGILVSLPKTGDVVKSPLKIEGEAKGLWFFEAQFEAILLDSQGTELGRAILTTQDDWMTENFVPFEGSLRFTNPKTSSGTLRFLSANPSGLPENQKTFEIAVRFSELPTQKVLLYYYNPEKDKDEAGNVKCSRDGLVAIEKDIPLTQTPIKDTINLLLKGKENLNQASQVQGVTTEYPLAGFSLTEVNLTEDGTLILKFNDPQAKTSGGACRVGILWSQVEATAKQFPQVKKVEFLPEDLFQP